MIVIPLRQRQSIAHLPLNSAPGILVRMYQLYHLTVRCLALAAALWSPICMSETPATQVRTFRLQAPVARVFPLFTALGEKAWTHGWKPQLLSGQEERGSVFRTLHGDHETTWIVVAYLPSEGRVSYARLVQGSNMGLVDVHCSTASGGATEVSVRYTLTGLNAQGEAFVDGFLSPAHYGRMIEEWREAISKALGVRAG
jgi:hypothetical protein